MTAAPPPPLLSPPAHSAQGYYEDGILYRYLFFIDWLLFQQI